MAKLLSAVLIIVAFCSIGYVAAAEGRAAGSDADRPLTIAEAAASESEPSQRETSSPRQRSQHDEPSSDFVEVIPEWLSDDPAAPRNVPLVPTMKVPATVPVADSGVAPPSSGPSPTPSRDTAKINRSVATASSRPKPMTEVGLGSLAEEPLGDQKQETPLMLGLLREAEEAFAKGNLIEPSHFNAYDRYRSVLILDKNNRKAHKGLQEILRRYSFLVKDAVDNNRLRRADALLQQLARFYPGNDMVVQHQQTLAQARRQQESQTVANVGKKAAVTEDISLPLAPLDKRSDELLSLLSEIVVRLIESDESILIYARSDSEGRWIYSQMKRLSGGYRIRGDIRVSSNPRISVLPPL